MQSGATSISYGGVSDIYANLSNSLNALFLGLHAVSITDPVTASQVSTIQGISNIGVVTSANLTDNAANLDAASSTVLGSAVNVNFTDAATIAQLTNVDGKTAATLVYTSVTDSAATLAANVGGYVKNAVNVTVSDTANLTQLAAIDLETTGTLTATNIADGAAALAANAGGYVKAGVNVTVNDAATLAQVKSIDDANGTGSLTANTIADTAALLAANTNGYVKAGVNVTVNDAASVSQLSTIDGLNGSGSLTYTVISDAAGTLVTNAGNYVTGSVNVTVSDAATLAQLSTIDLKTTGTLTANLVQDSVAALTANTDGYVKAGVSVTVTDAATIAQLTSLDGVNGTGSVTATTVTDSAANLFTNAGGYVKGAVNVSVSDAATIEQLTAIDNANGAGTLTYAALSDTSSNLLANITGTGTHYVISGKNVTVTDAVSLQTLASIDTANGAGTLTADSVIDAADKLVADTTYLSPTTHVEIQGAVSLADLKTIDDKSGVVVYNDLADDVAALVADTNSDIGGSVNVTVNDAASIADLTAIHIKTTGTLTYTSITDSADHLAADAASLTGFITGAVAVEVTGAISLSDLYAVDQKTTGTLTYSSISDTAANVVADAHHYINSGVAVTVSGVIALSDLVTLAGKSASVAYTEVTGTAAALAADALSNAGDGTFVITGKVIDVSDAATVQQLADIKAATGLNAHFTDLSDTGAALAGGAASVEVATTVTVTDAASLSDLAAISGHLSLSGELVYTAVKDTASNLVDNVGGYVNGSVNVTVSDAATVASLAAISAMTTGTVTAEDLADTHQNLFSPQGVLTSYVGAGSTVTVDGVATIAELKALVDRTGDATKVHYTSISDSLANLTSTDAAAFIKSGINVSIDSTANATVAQLAALDAANGAGTLTYSGVTDTAANLAADAVSVGTKYTSNQSVVVTDAATVQQLGAINGVADDVSYDKVTDTAAHLFADAGTFIVNGVTVTVSDAATIAQLASIDSHTDVELVYTNVTDSAANLLSDNGTYVNGSVAVTLTDIGSVAASTLKTIDTETTTQVDASSVATLTGDYSNISSVLGSAGIKLSGSEALILNDTAADLAGKTLHATTSTHDVLNVGLASVTTNLSGLTGFEDIFLAGSNRSTNAITIGDGDGVSVHAAAASTVILGSGQQSFFTSTGNDTVTVNAGSTFVFAASAAANGVDLVKNFAVGSNGSALDFSNFLGLFSSVGTEIVSDTSDSGGAANTVTLLDGNSVGLTTKNAISVADFDKNFLSTVNGKEVFVAFDNTAHSANVYFVNSAGGGSASVVDNAADITLVGTVSYTGSITSVSDLHLSSHLLPF
jgi:DNA-binding cell septation regulator SpoVG